MNVADHDSGCSDIVVGSGMQTARELAPVHELGHQGRGDSRRAQLLGKQSIDFSTASWFEILKKSMWHGGSVYDAWLTATSAQVS